MCHVSERHSAAVWRTCVNPGETRTPSATSRRSVTPPGVSPNPPGTFAADSKQRRRTSAARGPPCPESNAAYRPDSERRTVGSVCPRFQRAVSFSFSVSREKPLRSSSRRARRDDADSIRFRAVFFFARLREGRRARRATPRGERLVRREELRAPRAAGIHRATRRRRKVERDGNLTSRIDRLGFQTRVRSTLVHARRISRRIGRRRRVAEARLDGFAKTTSVSRRSARAARLGMCRNVFPSPRRRRRTRRGFRQLGGGGGGARERVARRDQRRRRRVGGAFFLFLLVARLRSRSRRRVRERVKRVLWRSNLAFVRSKVGRHAARARGVGGGGEGASEGARARRSSFAFAFRVSSRSSEASDREAEMEASISARMFATAVSAPAAATFAALAAALAAARARSRAPPPQTPQPRGNAAASPPPPRPRGRTRPSPRDSERARTSRTTRAKA